MKKVIGVLMVIGGLGIYVGLSWAFIGNIVRVIEAIRAPEIVAITIATGIVKIIFASFLGVLSASFLIISGISIIKGR